MILISVQPFTDSNIGSDILTAPKPIVVMVMIVQKTLADSDSDNDSLKVF